MYPLGTTFAKDWKLECFRLCNSSPSWTLPPQRALGTLARTGRLISPLPQELALLTFMAYVKPYDVPLLIKYTSRGPLSVEKVLGPHLPQEVDNGL